MLNLDITISLARSQLQMHCFWDRASQPLYAADTRAAYPIGTLNAAAGKSNEKNQSYRHQTFQT